MSLFDEEKINSHFNISISAVSCHRKGKYDAELQICDNSNYEKPVYKQVLIQSGFLDSNAARKAAAIHAEGLTKLLWKSALDYLQKYPDAKE